MTNNLLNILQKSFSDKSYKDISQYVGISPEATKNGLKIIIPNVLAAILANNTMSKSDQPTWWNALDSEYPYSDDEFVQTNNIDNTSFLVKGREVLSGMFRSNLDKLVSSVSSVSGIQKEKAAGLIEVAVPLIAGHLKNWMRRKNWKFKDLIENLINNEAVTQVKNATQPTSPAQPTNPAQATRPAQPTRPAEPTRPAKPTHIPVADFEDDNKPKEDFSETIKTEIPTTKVTKKKKNNGLVWFAGLVVLAFALWYFMGSKSCTRDVDNDDLLVPDITQVIIE